MPNNLKPYAAQDHNSRGRQHDEALPSPYRSQFQRDCDRIIHSSAFRRLEYKTQVFVNHVGDHFRTRLTHSLEVAQLSRTIGSNLGLNVDLCEAIALAHDLGHTPFGHAGQNALNTCMRSFGGFEHNLQSLRIVDKLERRYAQFDGLNLMFETREGLLKHCSAEKAKKLGVLGTRFIQGQQATLEAQLVNIADEIAYNNHDVDDGLRSGLISIGQMENQSLFARQYTQVLRQWPRLEQRRAVHETIRRMINEQIINLIETSQAQIEAINPRNLEEVRGAIHGPMITFSATMTEQHLELKRFLREHLYSHYQVQRMSAKAHHIITRLFEIFLSNDRLLPEETRSTIPHYRNILGHEAARARVVADYIAGMTDRFAILEYQRLFEISNMPHHF